MDKSGRCMKEYEHLRVRRSWQNIQSDRELKWKARLIETKTSVNIKHKKELFSVSRTRNNSNKYNDFCYSWAIFVIEHRCWVWFLPLTDGTNRGPLNKNDPNPDGKRSALHTAGVLTPPIPIPMPFISPELYYTYAETSVSTRLDETQPKSSEATATMAHIHTQRPQRWHRSCFWRKPGKQNLPTRPRTSTLVASDVVLFPCVELQRFLSQIDTPPYFITFIFLSSAIDLSEKAFSTPIPPPWQTINPNSIQTPIITFSSGFPLLTPFFSSPFTFFLLPLFFLLLSDFSLSFSLKLLQAISRK